MAKAASKHTPPIDWMSLKGVCEHVAKVYLSIEHVQRLIVGELAAGRVRWQWEGVYPPDESLDKFWQYPHLITVNWMASSATKKVVAGLVDVTASRGLDVVTVYGIHPALQDIEAAAGSRLSCCGRPAALAKGMVHGRKAAEPASLGRGRYRLCRTARAPHAESPGGEGMAAEHHPATSVRLAPRERASPSRETQVVAVLCVRKVEQLLTLICSVCSAPSTLHEQKTRPPRPCAPPRR